MARIRKIEIRNFRSIGWLDWFPLAGINCLIGPGDSGKSTILDAIDFCLGARRNLAFCDDDFHRLQLDQPIQISITLGELDSHLRSMEAYGLHLRGFDFQSGTIEDEPGSGLETVLTVELTVGDDLERRDMRHLAHVQRQEAPEHIGRDGQGKAAGRVGLRIGGGHGPDIASRVGGCQRG